MKTYEKVSESESQEGWAKTGSVRGSRKGKGRFDLISPIALKRLAEHYENGAEVYQDRNWEKGQSLSRFYDSAVRHLNYWILGYDEEDHLAAAAWNVFALIHTQEMIALGVLPAELDDIPRYKQQNGIPSHVEQRDDGDCVPQNPWYPFDNMSDWKDCLRGDGWTINEIANEQKRLLGESF